MADQGKVRRTTTIAIAEDGDGNLTIKQVTQTAERTDTRIECTGESGTSLKRKITESRDGRLFDRTITEDGRGRITTTDVQLTRSGPLNKRIRSRNAQGRECLCLTKLDTNGIVTTKLFDSLGGVTRRMERTTRPQSDKTIEIESK